MDKETITVRLKKCIQNKNLKPVFEFLAKNALKGGAEVSPITRRLIEELPDTDFGREQLIEVFNTLLSILMKSDLPSKISAEILSTLNAQVDNIPVNSCASIVYDLVDSLKDGIPLDGRWLEMLPQLLTTITLSGTVAARGNSMSGVEFKKLIVEDICSSPWYPKCAAPLARILSEIPLDSSELEFAVPKMMHVLPNLELAEVPLLVYHLLLSANQKCIEIILETVIRFFMEKDKEVQSNGVLTAAARENLEQTEATVILHIVLAARQNLVITRTCIRMLKARQMQASFIFNQFTLTLALSLAKMHPFVEQMLEVLKAALSSNAQRHAKYKESFWVREMIPKPEDTKVAIVNMIQNSKCGWEECSQNLAEFGFLLMDAFGPRVKVGKSEIAYDCCQLGLTIILEVFKTNKIACNNILDMIAKRLLAKSAMPLEHYFELFAGLIRADPQLLIQCQSRIQQVLSQLPGLPCHTTMQLLRATTPLIKVSLPLRDWLMILLRKLVFYRSLESRKVAVSGILILLRNLKSSESVRTIDRENEHTLSQIHVEVAQPTDPSSHRAVCMELLGLLNKCLTQQGPLRQLLYQGFPEVISQNGNLSDAILELLLVQLQKYYSGDDNSYPPLKLSGIVQINMDKAVLQEPLSHLVLCIHRCLMICERNVPSHIDDSEEHGDLPKLQLQKLMQNLIKVMVDAELEDFSLDKMSDFNSTSVVGQKNRLVAIQLKEICEALLEHSLSSGNWSASSAQVALKLFTLMTSLEQALRNPSKKKDSKAPGNARKKSLPSILSTQFLGTLLKNLFCSVSEYEGLSELLEDSNFVQYILMAARNELTRVQDSGTFEALYHNQLISSHFSIARVFLEVYKQHSKSADSTVASICIESLASLIVDVTKHHVGHLPALLATLEGANTSEESNLSQLVERQLSVFKKLVTDILTLPGDNNARLKELTPIMVICSALCRFVDFDSNLFSEMKCWMKEICKQQSITDPAVARSLLSFYLTLNHQTEECLKNFGNVVASIHINLGDIDEDTEINTRQPYLIINPKTAAAVTPIVLEHLRKLHDRVDWLLTVIRSDITLEAQSKDKNSTVALWSTRHVQEVGLCRQLGYLVATFMEFTQSKLPSGPCIEMTMKQLSRLYNSLSSLSKSYLLLYNLKLGSMCSKYEKLVKLAGTELTPHVYSMITFLQHAESEDVPGKKKQRWHDMQKAAVAKEMITIPSLIYAIEQHERLLIQLVKKSKVNLMEGIKMSAARDFRINSATVKVLLEECSTTDANQNNEECAVPAPSAQCSTATCSKKPPKKRPRKKLGCKE